MCESVNLAHLPLPAVLYTITGRGGEGVWLSPGGPVFQLDLAHHLPNPPPPTTPPRPLGAGPVGTPAESTRASARPEARRPSMRDKRPRYLGVKIKQRRLILLNRGKNRRKGALNVRYCVIAPAGVVQARISQCSRG